MELKRVATETERRAPRLYMQDLKPDLQTKDEPMS